MKLVLLILILTSFSLSALAKKGLEVGTTAPLFEANDINSKPFKLKSALQSGPVILVFYRGGWCPYCNLQLRNLQREVVPQLKKYGAKLVAISVDQINEMAKTQEKESLGMTLLSDPEALLLKKYNVVNKVPKELVKKYKESYKIDLEKYSGKKHHIIAVPGVFIVAQSGKVSFSYANENYKVRAQISDILSSLKNL